MCDIHVIIENGLHIFIDQISSGDKTFFKSTIKRMFLNIFIFVGCRKVFKNNPHFPQSYPHDTNVIYTYQNSHFVYGTL